MKQHTVNLNEKTEIEKAHLFGVMEWLKQQPEMKNFPTTSPESIFYHIAPLKYVELICRYITQKDRE